MKNFQKIYDYCLCLSKHKYASFFLCLNSFCESIFWPVPVECFLIPMSLAAPKKALTFAGFATLFSVIGAIIGYLIGFYAWETFVQPIFASLNYEHYVDTIENWFTSYGILFVAIGAFTPIPYKVIAITVGMMASSSNIPFFAIDQQLSIFTFVIVSILGRGLRFFLISFLIKLGGEKIASNVRRYIDIIGWICVILVIVVIAVYKIFYA